MLLPLLFKEYLISIWNAELKGISVQLSLSSREETTSFQHVPDSPSETGAGAMQGDHSSNCGQLLGSH